MISEGKDLKTKPRKRNSSATWKFAREGHVPWARLLQSLVNFSHPPLDSQKLCPPGCRPRVLRAVCSALKEDLLVRNWRGDTTKPAGSPNPGLHRSFQVCSDQRRPAECSQARLSGPLGVGLPLSSSRRGGLKHSPRLEAWWIRLAVLTSLRSCRPGRFCSSPFILCRCHLSQAPAGLGGRRERVATIAVILFWREAPGDGQAT